MRYIIIQVQVKRKITCFALVLHLLINFPPYHIVKPLGTRVSGGFTLLLYVGWKNLVYCKLKEFAQLTSDDNRSKICEKCDADGFEQFFLFYICKVNGGNVKDRFARTVADACAAPDIAVRAVRV